MGRPAQSGSTNSRWCNGRVNNSSLHSGVVEHLERVEQVGLDIRDVSALSFQHVQKLQPSTDKRGAEKVLARRKGARENTLHLARGDTEHSDFVDRVAIRGGVRTSRALVLSAIRRHLAYHAAYFPIRRLLDW